MVSGRFKIKYMKRLKGIKVVFFNLVLYLVPGVRSTKIKSSLCKFGPDLWKIKFDL